MIPLFFLIVLLGIADIVTTVRSINRGGTEINPVARPLFVRFGTLPVAIGLKLVFLAAIFTLALIYPQPVFLAAIAFVQAGIVAWNIFGLTK